MVGNGKRVSTTSLEARGGVFRAPLSVPRVYPCSISANTKSNDELLDPLTVTKELPRISGVFVTISFVCCALHLNFDFSSLDL